MIVPPANLTDLVLIEDRDALRCLGKQGEIDAIILCQAVQATFFVCRFWLLDIELASDQNGNHFPADLNTRPGIVQTSVTGDEIRRRFFLLCQMVGLWKN